jgi:hypothetical protein
VREALGFLVVDGLLALLGAALLYALGLVHASQGWRAALAIGPAFFCGVALALPILVLLLVIGVQLTLVTLVVVCVVAGGALLAVGLRCAPEPVVPMVPAASRLELWATRVGIAGLVLFAVLGAFAFPNLPAAGDDFRIWGLRAVALYDFGHLQPNIFLASPGFLPHLDYPLLQPALEALLYHGMGRIDLLTVHLELWIVYISFLWTAAFLLAPGRRPLLWLPAVAALAVAPGAYDWVRFGYADTTLACFLGAAVLCFGLWLESRRHAYVLLAGILLAAAGNAKAEGVPYAAIALIAVGLAVAIPRDWRSLAWVAVAAVVAIGGVLPWRLWVGAHFGPISDVPPLHTSLHYGFLHGRLDRLNIATKAIFNRFENQGMWVWIAPTFLAACAAALVSGVARRIALFYLGAAVGITVVLMWAYWTSNLEIYFHLTTSVDRTVSATLFVAVVGAAHLISALGARPQE